MAQFIAEIKGSRGSVTRLGSKKSGIWASVNGWRSGVDVIAETDANGRDLFKVYKTGGSNGAFSAKLVATISADNL